MLDGISAVEVIQRKFEQAGGQAKIHLHKERSFKAVLKKEGIWVDNLGTQHILPWMVFEETIHILRRQGGRAQRGDAMGCKLGDPGLPLDSIEGHIAKTVYGKQIGDSVFRRISPVAAILIWAGLCDSAPG